MKFKETKLKGAYTIDIEPIDDERGFFSRSFCLKEFKKYGLKVSVSQCNISYNKKRGTVRGMHYQVTPYEEIKLVSCIRGALYDVIIDLRPNSSTYRQWIAVELTAENYKAIYIPEGFAHGFQTLEDNTVIYYQVSEFYHPEYAKAVRWDDPAFGVIWPLEGTIISGSDRSYPLCI